MKGEIMELNQVGTGGGGQRPPPTEPADKKAPIKPVKK